MPTSYHDQSVALKLGNGNYIQNHKRILFIATGLSSITYAETLPTIFRHYHQFPSDKRIYYATIKRDTNRNYPTRIQSHLRLH